MQIFGKAGERNMQGSEIKFFGVLSVISGIALLLYSLRVSERIKRSREVEAKIVDTKTVHRRRRGTYYAPVYEYYEDGGYKRYTSVLYSSAKPETGKETVLYISDDGTVSEKPFLWGLRIGSILMIILGVLFSAAGLL